MIAYIARRVLLMIPTLFGIMVVNFAVIQFAPGGPVELMISQIRGRGTDANDPSVNLATATIEWIDALVEPIRSARARADAIVERTKALRESLAA